MTPKELVLNAIKFKPVPRTPVTVLNGYNWMLQKFNMTQQDLYEMDVEDSADFIIKGYELLDAEAIKCDNEHVSKMLYYIEEHITEELRLQTISEKMNLSKEYTSYIFKKETGRTLTDYVNERKILLAQEMIQGGEM